MPKTCQRNTLSIGRELLVEFTLPSPYLPCRDRPQVFWFRDASAHHVAISFTSALPCAPQTEHVDCRSLSGVSWKEGPCVRALLEGPAGLVLR